MKIISISEIVELNQILKEKAIDFRVHLSDACGSQSMWLEPIGAQETMPSSAAVDIVKKEIIAYFYSHSIPVQFANDRKTFWVDET